MLIDIQIKCDARETIPAPTRDVAPYSPRLSLASTQTSSEVKSVFRAHLISNHSLTKGRCLAAPSATVSTFSVPTAPIVHLLPSLLPPLPLNESELVDVIWSLSFASGHAHLLLERATTLFDEYVVDALSVTSTDVFWQILHKLPPQLSYLLATG